LLSFRSMVDTQREPASPPPTSQLIA
jgi:hypothetical protein